MSICYHTAFFACPADSATAFCGYRRLAYVAAVHCMAIVCGNICGLEAGQAKPNCCLQVWFGMSAVPVTDPAPSLLLFVAGSSLCGLTVL